MAYFGRYLSSQGSKNVLHYKYKGSDNSILYKLVLNPTYEVVINYIPLWLAPNLITLIGFFTVVFNHLVMAYYCPDLKTIAPSWVYYLNGFGLLFYQTMDALDGKQARRTNSSSPLGLLFDHGCDAMNITVSALSVASSLYLGATWKAMAIWITGASTFFAATWEEYYTHELNLPMINGPDEGVILCSMIHFASGFFGPEFWDYEVTGLGIQANTLLIAVSGGLAIVTIIWNGVTVCLKILDTKRVLRSKPGDYSEATIASSSFLVAFTRGLPFISIVIGMTLWMMHSPSDIFVKHPRLFLWTSGLLLSKLLTGLMVAHLCDEEYHPFTKTIAVVCFVGLHALYAIFEHDNLIESWHEDYALHEFFLISLISYSHMVFSLIWEMTTVLGIRCFVIKYKAN